MNKESPSIRISSIVFGLSVLVFFYVNTWLVHALELGRSQTAGANATYYSWQEFDGGVDSPGAQYVESGLTTSNVSGLRVLWHASTPAAADDSVVEQAYVNTSSGLANLVFVNTIKGNLIAYNALTGAKVWEQDPSSANFNGQGTKSTPAIDPSGAYVYAYALDGYVHKYVTGTGAEVTGGGWPEQVTLLPDDTEKGSASLNIAGGYLYMTLSGNDGDYGHYVGHVVAIKLSNGAKTVWNAECANITQLLTTSGANYCASTQSGMWARPGVKVDPVTGNVYATSGNGNYNANSGGNNWGDSIIELTPNLSSIVDSYTPASYSNLDSGDADLGSSAPVLLPKQNGSNTPYLMVQTGKDHIVRLLNRSNLSGQGGPRHTGGELQTLSINDEEHNEPATWVDPSGTTWVFVTTNSGTLYAYKVETSGGVTTLHQQYTESIGVSSSPFVTNGVLYFSGDNILAYNATTGAQLFNSSSIGVSLNQHWEAPVVINSEVITPDNNGNVYALYLPGVTPTAAPVASPSSGGSSGKSSGGSSGSGTSHAASGSSASSGGSAVSSAKSTPSPSVSPTASPSPSGSFVPLNTTGIGSGSRLTTPTTSAKAKTADSTKLAYAAVAGGGVAVIAIGLAVWMHMAGTAAAAAMGAVGSAGAGAVGAGGAAAAFIRRILAMIGIGR